MTVFLLPPESEQLEYKREFNSSGEKKRLLRTVVAFANGKGGKIRECLDFCVQGGFQGGSQSRLSFVYRGLKITDQRLRGPSAVAKNAPSATRRVPSYLASFHRVGKALTEE